MPTINLTDDEKAFLLKATQVDLEKFQAEEDTVLDGMPVHFMQGEKLYEEFLKKLIEKLKK